MDDYVESRSGDVAELEAATGRKVTRLRDTRTPMRWKDLEGKSPPERSWRIEHWLSTGATLLAGSGGVGKTLMAQTIATALALGRSYIDRITEPATVLFWACEDEHDELWRRQAAICSFFGAKLSDIDGRLIIEPRLGRDNTLFLADRGSVSRTHQFSEFKAQTLDYRADVAFLDNIGQTFGGNENDRHHVTTFVNGLSGISPACSMVLLGHPAKQNGSEFSGSSAWENCVRMRWFLSSQLPDQEAQEDDAEADPNTRYISKRKSNYTVKDFRKLTFRDGVFATEAEVESFSQRYTGGRREEIADAIVLKALDRFAESQVRVTEGKSSPDYLPRRIREMKLAQDCSARELIDAMNRLRLAGRIAEGPIGKYSNRGVKFGLIRVSTGAQS